MQNGVSRELIAARVARDLRNGFYVNLGIGLPTQVANFVPHGIEVVLQSENGILDFGPVAHEEEEDVELVNAGGQLVTLLPGASFFDMAESFAIIRGGHIDLSILGAFQVSATGDLANWTTSRQRPGVMGGAMDLATGAKEVWVMMEHVGPTGELRIVKECSYPLTARGVVNRIFTNIAVIEVSPQGLIVTEVAPGVSIVDVQAVTEPKLTFSPHIKEMQFS